MLASFLHFIPDKSRNLTPTKCINEWCNIKTVQKGGECAVCAVDRKVLVRIKEMEGDGPPTS